VVFLLKMDLKIRSDNDIYLIAKLDA